MSCSHKELRRGISDRKKKRENTQRNLFEPCLKIRNSEYQMKLSKKLNKNIHFHNMYN